MSYAWDKKKKKRRNLDMENIKNKYKNIKDDYIDLDY